MLARLRNKVADLQRQARDRARLAALERDWQLYGRYYAERRSAGNRIVVSLTSYPPRFATLHLTLKSLLSQSCLPERVVLWIAHGDMAQLPPAVTALQDAGLEIRACEDWKSYKKMLPLLQESLDYTVVTADDDVYYWRDWLRELADARVPGKLEVICHRMHRMRLAPDGTPLPYTAWEFESDQREASPLNFPTGWAVQRAQASLAALRSRAGPGTRSKSFLRPIPICSATSSIWSDRSSTARSSDWSSIHENSSSNTRMRQTCINPTGPR